MFRYKSCIPGQNVYILLELKLERKESMNNLFGQNGFLFKVIGGAEW